MDNIQADILTNCLNDTVIHNEDTLHLNAFPSDDASFEAEQSALCQACEAATLVRRAGRYCETVIPRQRVFKRNGGSQLVLRLRNHLQTPPA